MKKDYPNAFIKISIHAPREGGDYRNLYAYGDSNISIHAPREGGDATRKMTVADKPMISIHAPREGGDLIRRGADNGHVDFNPRPPRGGRLVVFVGHKPAAAFQSTPPARGATAARTG